MNKDVVRRLVRLEEAADARKSPSLSPCTRLLMSVVGLLIGKAEEHEALADGALRALGYDSGPEFRAALRDNDDGPDGFNARWLRVLGGFLRDNGLDPGGFDLVEFLLLVERLLLELPDSSHRRLAFERIEQFVMGKVQATGSIA
jgi:hypothetical protein